MTAFPHIPADVRQKLHDAGAPALALLNCWCGMRKGRTVPARRDLDPSQLGRYLSKVYLYEYDATLGDFVCRLAGEEVNNAWNARIRGKTFREVVGDDHHAAALTRWRAVIETPLVQFGTMKDERARVKKLVGERMIAPLRDDNGDVRLILGIGDYGVRQSDRDWIPPVWNAVIRIPCDEIANVEGNAS